MTRDPQNIFFCNGAKAKRNHQSATSLNYIVCDGIENNVYLGLPKFIQGVNYLPDRILDLLEIASYLFAADRLTKRGEIDSVEYHSWSRKFKFIIKVRDFDFWNDDNLKSKLDQTLSFITGDKEYLFDFQPGHSTFPTSLFDNENCKLTPKEGQSIILFSGGIDSLTGVIHKLKTTKNHVNLVSHQTQPGTKRTQNQLVNALEEKFPKRISFFPFGTNLHHLRAKEETQRTRSFLYTSIAFSLSLAICSNEIEVYENGITSLNFSRREDLINARSSRTTHPKSISLLSDLFSTIAEKKFTINLPFIWSTKSDVLKTLNEFGYVNLLSSTVSCSKTFQKLESATHCGSCFQCIDRRIAAYSSILNDIDHSGLYANDIILDPIKIPRDRTTIIDYLRQARNYNLWNDDEFQQKMIYELTDLPLSVMGCSNPLELAEKTYALCKKHGKQVNFALSRIRELHEDLNKKLEPGSLLHIISNREYLKDPTERMVNSIVRILSSSIPQMFRETKPKDEPDLNIKVSAILKTHNDEIRSEHPTKSFACAKVIPDHSYEKYDVLIESKFIRNKTTPSKASDGIAADITKYPVDKHILFLVYDPYSKIPDRDLFCNDFRKKRECTILIL